MEVTFELNGQIITCQVTSKLTLLRLLRDEVKAYWLKNGL